MLQDIVLEYLTFVMNKFDTSIDNELLICDKYGMTPNELFITKLILLAQEDEAEYLAKFLSVSACKAVFRDTLIKLQNIGIILKSYKIPEPGGSLNPVEIPIMKNFVKSFFKSSGELGKELMDTYPMFININGNLTAARGIAQKFDSMEDFFRFYGKTIKWNPEMHKKILELIKWEQENNIGFINQSIANFVINQGWNELENLKNGGSNYNYNAITLI